MIDLICKNCKKQTFISDESNGFCSECYLENLNKRNGEIESSYKERLKTKGITEEKHIFCKKCKKEHMHIIKITFNEIKNNIFLESYSKRCCGCFEKTVINYDEILTDEQLEKFSSEEITKRMEYQIKVKNEKYDYSKTNQIISMTLDRIIQLSKTDIIILNSLIELKDHDSDSILVNQSTIAKDLLLKQPNVARSVKKLIELKFLTKIDDNKYTIDFLEKFNPYREYE